jgi:carbonic anhydrase/acetyltransferase-like protein (isoleucine patch superfamily)
MIIPPRSLVAGSPAKIKRALSAEEVAKLRLSAANYQAYIERFRASGYR